MVRLIPPYPICDDAEFSADGTERLWLSRKVEEPTPGTTGARPVGLVIGLNPSKAGAVETDHTITKLKVFTRSWGWSGFWMANLFTYIETHSAKLAGVSFETAVGAYGTQVLEALIPLAPEIVVCWGAGVPKHKAHRAASVVARLQLMKQAQAVVRCFGHTASGAPVHPLRLAYETPLVTFRMPERQVSLRDD